MRIMSIANWKGGVGKSNNVMQLATILAEEEGKRVLIIDLDPQGNSGNNFGVSKKRKDINTTKDIFETEKNAQELIVQTKYENIFIIPSNVELLATEYKIISKAGRELFLKRFITRNKQFLEANFDIIFLDVSPSFNILNQNAFLTSDAIILVTDSSFNSLDGMEMFVEMWDEARKFMGIEQDNIKAVIINKYRKNTKIHESTVESIRKHPLFASIALDTVVPLSTEFERGEVEYKPVLKGVAKDTYKNIVKELKEREIL